MAFEKSLETGRTTSIIVKVSEYKGQTGIDVRKYYNGGPTKKGAFLVTEKGQHEFVLENLPKTLADSEERAVEDGAMSLVVRRYGYQGMEGYSIRKEGNAWGKGIWLNPEQAAWVVEAIAEAAKAL
jgi:hypothetical protein